MMDLSSSSRSTAEFCSPFASWLIHFLDLYVTGGVCFSAQSQMLVVTVDLGLKKAKAWSMVSWK